MLADPISDIQHGIAVTLSQDLSLVVQPPVAEFLAMPAASAMADTRLQIGWQAESAEAPKAGGDGEEEERRTSFVGTAQYVSPEVP